MSTLLECAFFSPGVPNAELEACTIVVIAKASVQASIMSNGRDGTRTCKNNRRVKTLYFIHAFPPKEAKEPPRLKLRTFIPAPNERRNAV